VCSLPPSAAPSRACPAFTAAASAAAAAASAAGTTFTAPAAATQIVAWAQAVAVAAATHLAIITPCHANAVIPATSGHPAGAARHHCGRCGGCTDRWRQAAGQRICPTITAVPRRASARATVAVLATTAAARVPRCQRVCRRRPRRHLKPGVHLAAARRRHLVHRRKRC